MFGGIFSNAWITKLKGLLGLGDPLVVTVHHTVENTIPLTPSLWHMPTVNLYLEIPEDGKYVIDYNLSMRVGMASGSLDFAIALSTNLIPGLGIIPNTGYTESSSSSSAIFLNASARSQPIQFSAGTRIYAIMSYTPFNTSGTANYAAIDGRCYTMTQSNGCYIRATKVQGS